MEPFIDQNNGTTKFPTFYLVKHGLDWDAHIYVYTLNPRNTAHPIHMSTLRDWVQETDPTNHEIDEVTTNTSLSTETSPPAKKIFHL
jgi:hypothetical protein